MKVQAIVVDEVVGMDVIVQLGGVTVSEKGVEFPSAHAPRTLSMEKWKKAVRTSEGV